MRLTIIGSLHGNLTEATKIAMDKGAKVTHAGTIETALEELRNGQGADLIMIEDTYNISDLVEKLESDRIHVPIVACGSGEDTRAAVTAIKAGAKEYIPLPPDPELIAAILTAVSRDHKSMIFADPVMNKVIELADQVAKSDASILITGESGTGKEIMARYVHDNSPRASNVFISLNCAAIPENLLESELFGHEKGAFTGAHHRRIGKFEEASGGTLLLDEITEMDIRLQAKLLRAIQERVIDRVGGNKPVPVDIRIIATSNRNLSEAVREGTFREDLLYRLNVVNLTIPPLRDRREDVLALSQHFVEKYAAANGMGPKTLSPEAIEALKANPWPGNVRELENVVERAVVLCTGDVIDIDLLPTSVREPRGHVAPPSGARLDGMSFKEAVSAFERQLIVQALVESEGVQKHAAESLHVKPTTLHEMMKRLKISTDDLDL